ncbi:MAG: DUF1080 domain-containing protein [Planctomycetaceae bacterium]
MLNNAAQRFPFGRHSVYLLVFGGLLFDPHSFAAEADLGSSLVQTGVQPPEVVPAEASPEKTADKPASVSAKPGALISPGADSPVDGTDLIATGLTEVWSFFSAREGVVISDVWKIAVVENERHLVCHGEPKGFLYTKKKYTNFELTFEWRYQSDPNANSGVLVYTQEEPRLWPTSIQVQLHQPQAGSIFPSGDATSDNTTEASGLALEIGEWNKCKITSLDGQVSVEINNKTAGKITGCTPATGFLALQSEGSETHFRRLLLKELPVLPKPTDPVNPLASPEPNPSSSNVLNTLPNAAG